MGLAGDPVSTTGIIVTGEPRDGKALYVKLMKDPDNRMLREEVAEGILSEKSEYSKKENIFVDNYIWFIRNSPECAITQRFSNKSGMVRGREYRNNISKEWKNIINIFPSDTKILRSSSIYFQFEDPIFAEEILIKGANIDKKSYIGFMYLGDLYLGFLKDNKGKPRYRDACKAYSNAYRLVGGDVLRFNVAKQYAMALYLNQDIDKAKEVANKAIHGMEYCDSAFECGGEKHLLNILLGRIAFQQGDISNSIGYLMKSTETPGSPIMDIYGPDLTLARELLRKGRKSAVVRYLKQCRNIWKYNNGKLDLIIKVVEGGGEIPDD